MNEGDLVIKFRCKNCNQEIAVQDKLASKRVKCPNCGDVGVVPDTLTKIKFHCKNCGQKISVPEIHAGKKGKCPKCKNIVIVPKMHTAGSETKPGKPGDLKGRPQRSDFDLSFLDIPQQDKAPDQPTAQHSVSDRTLEDLQKLEERLGVEKTEVEPIGRRKLPWLIDIFLYPIDTSGLTALGIIIFIPLLINIVADLLGPFGFFVAIPGIFVNITIGMYAYWYFAECIRDSAGGGLRAPNTMATTPGIGELFWQLIKIVGCLVFFFAPMVIYFLYTRKTDMIFWYLLGYAGFFFPMGLLAVIMFDSLSGVNPILLIGSIFSTFFQYCGLVLFFYAVSVLGVMTRMILAQGLILFFISKAIGIYLLMVGAHLLGRFYWRYQEKLNWEV